MVRIESIEKDIVHVSAGVHWVDEKGRNCKTWDVLPVAKAMKLLSDYQSLQAALRIALDGWDSWLNPKDIGFGGARDRIAELRKFLDIPR